MSNKTNLIFEFKDLETKQKQVQKKIENIFNAAGKIKPVEIEIDGKTKRNNGISYKQIFCEFADSQTVILKVKQSGDIFEVLLNKKILPIANQDNHRKAVGEVINAMEKGRSAFQKKLAKAKATLPPSVKSTIVSKQQAMDEKKAALLEAIQAVQSELDAVNAEIDTYQKQLDAGKNLANHIQNIMPDTQEETNTEAQLAREENNELERHAENPSGEIGTNFEDEEFINEVKNLRKEIKEYENSVDSLIDNAIDDFDMISKIHSDLHSKFTDVTLTFANLDLNKTKQISNLPEEVKIKVKNGEYKQSIENANKELKKFIRENINSFKDISKICEEFGIEPMPEKNTENLVENNAVNTLLNNEIETLKQVRSTRIRGFLIPDAIKCDNRIKESDFFNLIKKGEKIATLNEYNVKNLNKTELEAYEMLYRSCMFLINQYVENKIDVDNDKYLLELCKKMQDAYNSCAKNKYLIEQSLGRENVKIESSVAIDNKIKLIEKELYRNSDEAKQNFLNKFQNSQIGKDPKAFIDNFKTNSISIQNLKEAQKHLEEKELAGDDKVDSGEVFPLRNSYADWKTKENANNNAFDIGEMLIKAANKNPMAFYKIGFDRPEEIQFVAMNIQNVDNYTYKVLSKELKRVLKGGEFNKIDTYILSRLIDRMNDKTALAYNLLYGSNEIYGNPFPNFLQEIINETNDLSNEKDVLKLTEAYHNYYNKDEAITNLINQVLNKHPDVAKKITKLLAENGISRDVESEIATKNNSQNLVENNTNNSRRDKDIAELQKIISGEDTRTNKELRPFIAELTDLYKNDEEIKNLMNQALNTLINKAKQKRDEIAKNI